MHGTRIRTLAAASAVALAATGSVVASAASAAASADAAVPATSVSKQWKKCGFPTTPNTTAWGPGGTATVSPTTAPAGTDVVMKGKAPTGTPAGTVLKLMRYTDVDSQCDVTAQATSIKTKVTKKGTFELRAELGRVGTFGYSVGYVTKGDSPETVAFQFQLTTTA